MAKLVILTEGMTGRSHELTAEKTTIGRLEDNTFTIGDPSVSSHHCEVLLRGSEVIVRDLNSTNGTYINGERITEAPLKPGQILRLGQVELRLEAEAPPAPAAAARKTPEGTMILQRGISPTDLEQSARASFDTVGAGFSKKDDKAGKIFLYVSIGVGVVIVALLIYAFFIARTGT
ncbi:MAG: FHA domain-containing protein [Verrucomicrobiales bacterium]|nr:FHA domain-containing protein [Verrucomicrobiales bacterium]